MTAAGELVRADAEHHADLFWALRGGGGNFGVVTHMEISLYPLTEVYAGMMFWPWECSAEVLKAWAAWTRTALLMSEIRHFGGALGRAPEGHGALARFEGECIMYGVGIPVTPDMAAAIHLGIAALGDALAPWESGSADLNFTEATVDPAQFYSGESYARLRRVKAEVDPEGRFRGNHAIDAA